MDPTDASNAPAAGAQTADLSANSNLRRWQACAAPEFITLKGQYCQLIPLDPEQHAADLYAAYASALYPEDWAYLPYGPFLSYEQFKKWLIVSSELKHYYVIVAPPRLRAQGLASFLNVDPQHGVLEVGAIKYARCLQKTTAATEAMFLMMEYAFDSLGYRRYQWCCDSRNQASKRAALRLGFCFEGVLRQAKVVKGENRDTAVYSLLDHEWPRVKQAFLTWLHPNNFTSTGEQKQSLTAIRKIL